MSGDGIGTGAQPTEPFEGSITPEASGPDSLVQKNDDIPQQTKTKLGDYLSAATKDKRYGNAYPIAPGSAPRALQNANGIPVQLAHGNNGAEHVFASHEDANKLSQYSDSGIGVDLPPLSDMLTKGQGVGGQLAVDGHSLLPNVQQGASGIGQDGRLPTDDGLSSDPVIRRTSNVLALNRFTVGQAFANARQEYATRQRQFGSYDPDAPVVTLDDMSKIGKSLSLRATGEFLARRAGDDPDSSAVQLGALLPGEAQLGITRIDTIDLEAREVFRELFGEPLSGRLESELNTSTDSYGNMTNIEEHFDSLAPTGMLLLAVAMILAAQVALRALLAVIALLTGGKTGKSDLLATDAIGRPFLGDYRLNNTNQGGFPPIPLPPSLLGLKDVNFEFNRAVNAGVAAFFGGRRDPLGAIVDAINPFGGETFKRAAESPGFYVVFVRNISRSLNTIANTVKNTSFSLNPIDIVEGVGNIIDTIRRSKVIAVLNLFAQLGERVLVLESQGFDVTAIAKGSNKISKVDALPDNAAAHVMKSRRTLSMQLAWRNSSTTSKLLLPTSVAVSAMVLAKNGGVVPFGYGALQTSDTLESKVVTQNNRLPAETVRRIEAQLDAEYVPFYFHDLRTNEIVSFHAFLEAMTDEYSANHESVEAYGRIDPVYAYKNTVRSISMTFFAVATSHSDMDEMYAKVNKLVTLVYPQFSGGTVVKDEQGNSFVQPFSQTIAGSPLIRLRLGDIMRSNYSRFNLARLFGLGTDAFNINGESLSGDDSDVKKLLELSANITTRFRDGAYAAGDIVKLRANGSPVAFDAGLGYPPAVEGGGDLLGALGSAIGLPSGDPIPPLVIAYPVKAEIKGGFDVKVGNSSVTKFIVKLIDQDVGVTTDQGKPDYVVNSSDIIIDNEVLASNLEASGASLGAKAFESEKFFAPDGNVVVRSFENMGGKGLAGVITSMGFDWLAGPWETERYGSRAPKLLKVTLAFSPIHDIPPGIDATGFNRAPIYNVGSAINSVAGDGPDNERKGSDAFHTAHRNIATFANKRSAVK